MVVITTLVSLNWKKTFHQFTRLFLLTRLSSSWCVGAGSAFVETRWNLTQKYMASCANMLTYLECLNSKRRWIRSRQMETTIHLILRISVSHAIQFRADSAVQCCTCNTWSRQKARCVAAVLLYRPYLSRISAGQRTILILTASCEAQV